MGKNILQTQKFKSEIEVINRIKWSLIYIDLEKHLLRRLKYNLFATITESKNE